MELDKARVIRIIKAALIEDVGKGDITSFNTIGKSDKAKARIFAKEKCVLCGIKIAEWVFATIDSDLRFNPQVSDGQTVESGTDIAFIEGRARPILIGERLAMNFLSLLSGVATETKKYVEKVEKYGSKIMDTRKTFPLLRYLEKYAVATAGGHNHRMNLGEMIMIKDNHLKLIRGKVDVFNLRKKTEYSAKIELETENLNDFEEILDQRPDVIMLDNMSVQDVEKAVKIRNEKRAINDIFLEASGGITLENVESYAKTGVEAISIGAITDSVKGVDFSLEII